MQMGIVCYCSKASGMGIVLIIELFCNCAINHPAFPQVYIVCCESTCKDRICFPCMLLVFYKVGAAKCLIWSIWIEVSC